MNQPPGIPTLLPLDGSSLTESLLATEVYTSSVSLDYTLREMPSAAGEDAMMHTLSPVPTAASYTYVWTEGLTISNNSITGGYYDADKINPYVGGVDCMMCWAGAASNMIAWWQNHYGAYFTVSTSAPVSADDVFAEFRRYWKNEGAYTFSACQWWLAGDANNSSYERNYANKHKPNMEAGGGFYSRFYDSDSVLKIAYDQRAYERGALDVAQDIANIFNDGGTISLCICEYETASNPDPGAHALTLWGITRESTGEIAAVHFTDSNDRGDKVVTINVRYNTSTQNYDFLSGSYRGWYLHSYQVMKGFDYINVVKPTQLQRQKSGNTITFTWSGEQNAGLRYEFAYQQVGAKYSKRVFTSNQSYTLTLSGDGEYMWWVRAVNGTKELTGWTQGSNFTLGSGDSTAPVVSIKSPLWSVQGRNATSVTFRWSSNESATYTLTVGGKVLYRGSNNSFTTTLADGLLKYTITATDAAGNSGSKTTSFRCDTKAPARPSQLSVQATNNGGSASFSWKAVPDLSGVRYEFACKKYGESTYTTYSSELKSPGLVLNLGAARWQWRVRAIDGKGNVSSWAQGKTFSNDTTPPAVSVSTPALQKQANWKTSATLSWLASESATFALMVDGKTVYRGKNNNYTLTLKDGTHKYKLTAIDSSGNKRSQSGSFLCDTIARKPTGLSVQLSANGAQASFRWQGGTDPSGLSYELAVKTPGSSSYKVYGKNLSSGSFVLALSGEGRYSWRVRAIDGRGNASGWVTGSNFVHGTVDNTPPRITMGVPSLAFASSGRTKVSFSWSCNENATYSLWIDGASYYSGKGTSYSALLADGTYRYKLTATDAAGNSSSQSGSFLCDTTAPTDPSGLRVQLSDGGSRVSFSWNESRDPSGVSYQLAISYNGGEYQYFDESNASASYTLNVRGDWYWYVRAYDARNNSTDWVYGGMFSNDGYTWAAAPAAPTASAAAPLATTAAPAFSLDQELALSAGSLPVAAALGSVAGLSAGSSLLPESQDLLSRQRSGTLAATL